MTEQGKGAAQDGNTGAGSQGQDGKLLVDGLPENFESLPKAEQTKILNEKFEELGKKAKQVEDKEAMIQKQASEIGDLRKLKSEVEPILEALKKKEGDTSKQDELTALLEEGKKKYSADDLDYLNKLVKVANNESNKRTQNMLMNVLTNVVDMGIAHDKSIDQKVYVDHKEEILREYNRFKDAGTIGEMQSNLKESYAKVEARVIAEAKKQGKIAHEATRDEAINAIGGNVPAKGSKGTDTRSGTDKIADDIVAAGSKGNGGVFG